MQFKHDNVDGCEVQTCNKQDSKRKGNIRMHFLMHGGAGHVHINTTLHADIPFIVAVHVFLLLLTLSLFDRVCSFSLIFYLHFFLLVETLLLFAKS